MSCLGWQKWHGMFCPAPTWVTLNTGIFFILPLSVYFYSEETVRQRRDRAVELEQLEKQLLQLTTDIKDKIKAMTEDVERKVRKENQISINRQSVIGLSINRQSFIG